LVSRWSVREPLLEEGICVRGVLGEGPGVLAVVVSQHPGADDQPDDAADLRRELRVPQHVADDEKPDHRRDSVQEDVAAPAAHAVTRRSGALGRHRVGDADGQRVRGQEGDLPPVAADGADDREERVVDLVVG
jgi:hypothetical protein